MSRAPERALQLRGEDADDSLQTAEKPPKWSELYQGYILKDGDEAADLVNNWSHCLLEE